MTIEKRTSRIYGSYVLLDDAGGVLAWFQSLHAAVIVKRFIDGDTMTDGEKAEALIYIQVYDEKCKKG